MFSSNYKGHAEHCQMVLRYLTACQYRQLRVGFSQSISRTPSHKLSLSKDTESDLFSSLNSSWGNYGNLIHEMYPYTYIIYIHVCLSLRGFKKITYFKYCTVSTAELAQCPNKYNHIYTQCSCVLLLILSREVTIFFSSRQLQRPHFYFWQYCNYFTTAMLSLHDQ